MVTVMAVGLAFVSSIYSPDEQSVLSVVQLLWLNLIQDTFAALALATDPPTLDLLNRKPEKDTLIISPTMWKMIMGQSALQLIVTFILVFAGPWLFPGWSALELETVVFNTFSLLQVSNQINCRRIDSKFNVFVGICTSELAVHRDYTDDTGQTGANRQCGRGCVFCNEVEWDSMACINFTG